MHRDDMTFYKCVKHIEISIEISSEKLNIFFMCKKVFVPPHSSVQAFFY